MRGEALADSAYINADHFIAARERHSIDLAGPGRRNLGWQNRTEGAFGLTDPAMDRDRWAAYCPEGKKSAG